MQISCFQDGTLGKLQAGSSEGGTGTDLATSADPNQEGDGDTTDSGSLSEETLDDLQFGSFQDGTLDNAAERAAEDQERAAEAEEDAEEAQSDEDQSAGPANSVEAAVEHGPTIGEGDQGDEQWSQGWIGHPRHMRPINAWTWQEWHNWSGKQPMDLPSIDQQHSQEADAKDGTAEEAKI